MSLDDFISIIRNFKNSDVTQEREVYACIITGLFEEFRFHEYYPDYELNLTGDIFGKIIVNNLIDNKPLTLALNIIITSFKE